MVFARCASRCSSLPTLPRAASAVLASSPCGGCSFRLLVKISKLSIRTYRCCIDIILTCNHVKQQVVRRQLALLDIVRSEVRFPEGLPFFMYAPFFFHLSSSGTVCGFTTEHLNRIDYYYADSCTMLYDVFVHTCHVFLLLLLRLLLSCCCCRCSAAACCCCSSSCAG